MYVYGACLFVVVTVGVCGNVCCCVAAVVKDIVF